MAIDLDNIIQINSEILEDIKIELAAQGHELTGKTFQSLRPDVRFEGGTLVMEGKSSFVIEILNEGVAVERIPYTPGAKTGAGTSKYIQALKEYAKKRFGLDDKKALAAAFAIAHKHAKEGMPTQSSKRFSETGKRTHAIETVFVENKDRFEKKIGDGIKSHFDGLFKKVKSETV